MGSHLRVLEGFVSSRERRFNRLGCRLDFARPISLAQPGAGMLQPVIIVKNVRRTSGPIHSLAEVEFALLEAM